MRNKLQVLPIIASVGIGAAAYSMMTGRGGQLQNMIPGLSNMPKWSGVRQPKIVNQQQEVINRTILHSCWRKKGSFSVANHAHETIPLNYHKYISIVSCKI